MPDPKDTELMTIIESYTGDSLHENDTYEALEQALTQWKDEAVKAERERMLFFFKKDLMTLANFRPQSYLTNGEIEDSFNYRINHLDEFHKELESREL